MAKPLADLPVCHVISWRIQLDICPVISWRIQLAAAGSWEKKAHMPLKKHCPQRIAVQGTARQQRTRGMATKVQQITLHHITTDITSHHVTSQQITSHHSAHNSPQRTQAAPLPPPPLPHSPPSALSVRVDGRPPSVTIPASSAFTSTGSVFSRLGRR